MFRQIDLILLRLTPKPLIYLTAFVALLISNAVTAQPGCSPWAGLELGFDSFFTPELNRTSSCGIWRGNEESRRNGTALSINYGPNGRARADAVMGRSLDAGSDGFRIYAYGGVMYEVTRLPGESNSTACAVTVEVEYGIHLRYKTASGTTTLVEIWPNSPGGYTRYEGTYEPTAYQLKDDYHYGKAEYSISIPAGENSARARVIEALSTVRRCRNISPPPPESLPARASWAAGTPKIISSTCGVRGEQVSTAVPVPPPLVNGDIDYDRDEDGVWNDYDFYPDIPLGGRLDTDGDGIPDECDLTCESTGMTADLDDDGDGHNDDVDNCPLLANPGQEDSDGDQVGDMCDPTNGPDADGDGVIDSVDNCISIPNPGQEPSAINPDCGQACVTSSCAGPRCVNR